MAKTSKKDVSGMSVDDRLAAVEESVESAYVKIRAIMRVLEKMFGLDIDRDGKVGSARIAVLCATLLVGMIAIVWAGDAGLKWGLGSGSGMGQFVSDGTKMTLEIDIVSNQLGKVVCSNLTILGTYTGPAGSIDAAGLTGNVAAGRMTNGAATLGASIGGNIPSGSITQAMVTAVVTYTNAALAQAFAADTTATNALNGQLRSAYATADTSATNAALAQAFAADTTATGLVAGVAANAANLTSGNIGLARATNILQGLTGAVTYDGAGAGTLAAHSAALITSGSVGVDRLTNALSPILFSGTVTNIVSGTNVWVMLNGVVQSVTILP